MHLIYAEELLSIIKSHQSSSFTKEQLHELIIKFTQDFEIQRQQHKTLTCFDDWDDCDEDGYIYD